MATAAVRREVHQPLPDNARDDIRPPMTVVAAVQPDDDAPATAEWLATQAFSSWDLEGLSAPTDAEWARLADPHALALRAALHVLGQTQGGLTRRIQADGAGAAAALDRITDTLAYLTDWTAVLAAAEARLLCVGATIQIGRESETSTERGDATQPRGAGFRSILSLAGDWAAAQQQAESESSRLQTAEAAAAELRPEVPHLIADPRHPAYPRERAELQQLDATGGRSETHRVEAYDRWSAQCSAIDASFGVAGLEEASDRAFAAAEAVARRITAQRPGDVREAAVKFGVLLALNGDGRGGFDDPRPIRSFLGDLETLARASSR